MSSGMDRMCRVVTHVGAVGTSRSAYLGTYYLPTYQTTMVWMIFKCGTEQKKSRVRSRLRSDWSVRVCVLVDTSHI